VAQKSIYIGENLFTVSKKTETSLNLFWYGLIVYMVFFVLAAAETSFISPASCQAFQIIGFLGMVVGGYDLIRFKFDSEYQKILFILNLLYSVTIILRGAEYDKDAIKQMFLDPTYGILPYFASVVMLLQCTADTWRFFFDKRSCIL
jgi:hypothetical protein